MLDEFSLPKEEFLRFLFNTHPAKLEKVIGNIRQKFAKFRNLANKIGGPKQKILKKHVRREANERYVRKKILYLILNFQIFLTPCAKYEGLKKALYLAETTFLA